MLVLIHRSCSYTENTSSVSLVTEARSNACEARFRPLAYGGTMGGFQNSCSEEDPLILLPRHLFPETWEKLISRYLTLETVRNDRTK